VDPVPDPLLPRKSGSANNLTWTSGSVARNSDLQTTEVVKQCNRYHKFDSDCKVVWLALTSDLALHRYGLCRSYLVVLNGFFGIRVLARTRFEAQASYGTYPSHEAEEASEQTLLRQARCHALIVLARHRVNYLRTLLP
jgi:hypothetical protein